MNTLIRNARAIFFAPDSSSPNTAHTAAGNKSQPISVSAMALSVKSAHSCCPQMTNRLLMPPAVWSGRGW